MVAATYAAIGAPPSVAQRLRSISYWAVAILYSLFAIPTFLVMLLFAFQSLKHALLLAPCVMVLVNALLLLRVPFSGYLKRSSRRAILKHAAVLHAVWVSLFTVIVWFIPGPAQAEKLGAGSLCIMWLAFGPVPALTMLGIGSMSAGPDDTD